MAYQRKKENATERCEVPNNPNHVLPKELIQLEQDVELALADPIECIAMAMERRGFSSLWTEKPATNRIMVFDDDAKTAFLRKLAVGGRMAYASQCVGVSVNVINDQRRTDPAFGAAVEEALHYFRDLLEAEMYRRGVTGYTKQVLGGSNKDQIFEITEFSDRMMDTLAKIHLPALQKKALEIKGVVAQEGPSTVNITNNFDFSKMPSEELEQFKQLLKKQQTRDEDAIDGEFTDA